MNRRLRDEFCERYRRMDLHQLRSTALLRRFQSNSLPPRLLLLRIFRVVNSDVSARSYQRNDAAGAELRSLLHDHVELFAFEQSHSEGEIQRRFRAQWLSLF